ncbi:hypothetical protein B0H34DRAFT_686176 [Crassisporium funariophilum]|nr:hypothetical protein B0H34DRAFT_686176 [Crassisporium funariophilum]
MDGVYICAKKLAYALLQRPNDAPSNDPLDLQGIVDVMHALIQQLNHDPHRVHRYQDYCSILISLCKRTKLFPSKLHLDRNLIELSERPALNNGATAMVHHGYMDGKPVAAKDFRIYVKTQAKVKVAFLKEALFLFLTPQRVCDPQY